MEIKRCGSHLPVCVPERRTVGLADAIMLGSTFETCGSAHHRKRAPNSALEDVPANETSAFRHRSLLFITDVFPNTQDSGQNIRIQNLLKALCIHFNVTILLPEPPHEGDWECISELCHYALFVPQQDVPCKRSPMCRSKNFLTARWYQYLEPYCLTLSAVDLNSFHLVWIERNHMSPLGWDLAPRTIIDFDDIEHVVFARRIRASGHGLWRPHHLAKLLFLWYRDIVASRRFLAVTVCSEKDKAYLNRWGLKRVEVVPNGFEIEGSGMHDELVSTGHRIPLIFLGNLKHPPNFDALQFFATAILPIVRNAKPGLRLDIIGPGATEELKAHFGDALTFHGFVDDVQEWLECADVFVAPIRWGGGTKVKLLAAMAACTPIVTTSVGAEGLKLVHGESALIADDPEQLALNILALLDDRPRAKALADRAHEVWRNHFRWSVIGDLAGAWAVSLTESVGRTHR